MLHFRNNSQTGTMNYCLIQLSIFRGSGSRPDRDLLEHECCTTPKSWTNPNQQNVKLDLRIGIQKIRTILHNARIRITSRPGITSIRHKIFSNEPATGRYWIQNKELEPRQTRSTINTICGSGSHKNYMQLIFFLGSGSVFLPVHLRDSTPYS